MEIKYLKNLENSPIKGDSIIPKDRGVPEQEILIFEEKVQLSLPKALKEFLFLAGNYCLSIEANALNQGLDEYKFRHEQFEEAINDAGISISKPYYVLSEVNSDEFDFIYLSEGDNPAVHNLYVWDDEKYKLEKKSDSFSEWIDQEIAIRLKNQSS